MPPQEVGEAFVAIRAIATQFQEQASAEVNSALARVREQATVQIRAVMDQTGAQRIQQSFQPVVQGAQNMGNEVERSYGTVGSSSHSAYERVQLSHDGIRARFGETLRAASAMGGGVALAYAAFSQGRQAIQVTNELAHATNLLSASTGLNAHTASAWISVAQSQGIQATSLQTAFNSLSRVTTGASDAYAKAGASAQQNLAKIHTEQIRVNADAIAYNDAIAKYGQGSSEATSKLATLSSAQSTLKGYMDATTTSISGSAGAFARLGITQQQLQQVQGNLPAELGLIADKFQGMGAGTDRATIAQQIFGRSYSQLLPLLDQGSAGIQKNIDIATKYGATLSGPTLAGMDKLRVEQQQLSLEMTGLRVRIASALEPALISVGLKAVDVASKFGTILSGGIGLAKRTMDAFTQSPYGKAFDTIAGDAVRFANIVRGRFVHDLTGPLDFGRLFTNFTTDLTTALPQMAKQFWTQLNQDLFAPGKDITVRAKFQLKHEGVAMPQLTGAGLFPGSGFVEQGKILGDSLIDGMMNSLKKIFGSSQSFGAILANGLNAAVKWVATGGGAAKILGGALTIADAFLRVLFDPSFWLDNWKVILDLAVTLFPYDKILVIPGRILEALGVSGFALRMFDRLFGPLIDLVRGLPTRIGLAIGNMGKFIADGLGATLPELGGFTAKVGVLIEDLFSAIGNKVADAIPRLVIALFTDLSGSVDKGSNALFDKILGLFEGGLISRLFAIFARFVLNATIIGFAQKIGGNIIMGIWEGLENASGWLWKQISGLFDEFISFVEGILGISSPSTVAAGWGVDIVRGLMQGLENLPVIGRVFRVEFAAVELVVKAAMAFIRNIFDAEVAWVKAWANLIGDLIHGRWSNIMHDLDAIVHSGIRLVNALLGGLPGDVIKVSGIVATAAQHLGSRLLNGIVDEAKKLPGQVETQIRRLGSMEDRLIGWLVGEGKKIGSAILQGVINGVKSAPGAIGGALKDAAGGALHDVTSWAGIGSPSRLFQDKIGTPLNDGIIKGFDPLHDQMMQAIIPPTTNVLSQAHTQTRSQAVALGTGIATGIRSGLSPLQSLLTSAIVGASNAAMTAAKRALGISSPSLVYAEQIGKPLAQGIIHGMGGLEKGLADRITKAAQSATMAAGSFGGGASPTGSAATSANQKVGYQMMLGDGWPASQWGALQALWNRESGWNQFAKNPSSGAFGIPQELGHAVSSAYLAGDVHAQIAWGLDYIRARYGSPSAAWAHEESVGWYHGGGVVPGSPTQNVPAVLRGGEVVFTPEQMSMLSGRAINIGQINIYEQQNARGFVEDLNAIAARIG